MVRFFRDSLRILPGIFAALFIGLTVTLFVVFPRLVNQIANLTGYMGDPLDARQAIFHGIVVLLIDVLLFYFFVMLPLRQLRRSHIGQGLEIRRGQGIAYLDTESVRQQVYAAIARITSIARADVQIDNHMGRAAVQINLLTISTINASRKKAEVRREVKKVIEDQLGIVLAGEPLINITLEAVADVPPVAASPDLKPDLNVSKTPRLEESNREPIRIERLPASIAPTTTTSPDKPPLTTPLNLSSTPPLTSPILSRRPFSLTGATITEVDEPPPPREQREKRSTDDKAVDTTPPTDSTADQSDIADRQA